jgi:oligoribonuclease
MSGLNPECDHLLEISTIITDSNLDIIALGPNLVIHQEAGILDAMDDWNSTHHKKSGLYEQSLKSLIDLQSAEKATLNFLEKYCSSKSSPLCGNTVHQDRAFLKKYMPKVEAFLHYRHIDVSTVKELAKRWAPEIMDKFIKKEGHRAQEDILESIEELRYYRQYLFCKTNA